MLRQVGLCIVKKARSQLYSKEFYFKSTTIDYLGTKYKAIVLYAMCPMVINHCSHYFLVMLSYS